MAFVGDRGSLYTRLLKIPPVGAYTLSPRHYYTFFHYAGMTRRSTAASSCWRSSKEWLARKKTSRSRWALDRVTLKAFIEWA